MIVEIQGVDEERMEKLEEVILPRLGLVNITKTGGFDRKIRLSADTGEIKWVNTHLNIWGKEGVRVYLREPGELCVTIEGSLQWVVFIAGFMGATDIIKNGVELELAKRLEVGYKK